MLAKEFCSQLLVIPDPQLQAHKLSLWLQQTAETECVLILQEVVDLALNGEESARKITNPLLLTTAILDILPNQRRKKLHDSAQREGLPVVQGLFAELLPYAEEPAFHTFPVPDIRPKKRIPGEDKKDPITLGERRSLAKTQDPKIIEKLILDPDPRVIGHLLDNPHLFEDHVLKMASRRPYRAELLRLIGCHRRWGANPRVRLALAFNPHSPPALAIISLISTKQQDLERLAFDENLHPLVRSIAKTLLKLRQTLEP